MQVKKTIKKIAAIAAGATMVGSTLFGAAAADLANYPAPFIQDGQFDAILVVGDSALPQDIIGIADIQSSLQFYSRTATTGGSVSVKAVGESYQIETSSNKLNFGEQLTSVQTVALDHGDLPTLLAKGDYSNGEGTEYEYEQKITLNDTNLQYTFFQDSDYMDKEPALGIRVPSGGEVFRYELKFNKNAESDNSSGTMTDFEDTEIEMLGKKYDIVTARTSGTEITLELMGGAKKDTITEGETETYTIDGVDYEVECIVVTDTAPIKTKLKINGETTRELMDGETDKVAGIQIGIRSILPNEAGDVTGDLVEFYLGADKLTIYDDTAMTAAPDANDNIQLNEDDVDTVYGDAYFTQSGTKFQLNKLVLTWKVDEDMFIAEDSDLTLPGLESVKLSYQGLTTPTEEHIILENKGDYEFELTMPIDGAEDGYTFVLLNATTSGPFGFTFGSEDKLLLFNGTANPQYDLNKDRDLFFVASDSNAKETHLVELRNCNKDGCTFRDLATGTDYEDKGSSDGATAEDFTIGDVTLRITKWENVTDTATVTVMGTGVGNRLYTPEGLSVHLPTNDSLVGDDTLNSSDDTYTLVFREEDKDETLDGGDYFNATLKANRTTGATAVKAYVSDVGNITEYELESDEDMYVGYLQSQIGTKVMWDKGPDQYTLDIYYYGGEVYGNVYVTGDATTFVEGSESAVATEIVRIDVGAAQLASKVQSQVGSANMIVIGGPCVNSVAAELMGNPESCAEGFAPGKAMIKLFEEGDYVAMLVAGYSADDTTAASRVVANYEDYADDLVGMEVEVTETTSSTPTVGAPAEEEESEE